MASACKTEEGAEKRKEEGRSSSVGAMERVWARVLASEYVTSRPAA